MSWWNELSDLGVVNEYDKTLLQVIFNTSMGALTLNTEVLAVLTLRHYEKAQHTCVELDKVDWQNPLTIFDEAPDYFAACSQLDAQKVKAALAQGHAVSVYQGDAKALATPLVLMQNKFYFHKRFMQEWGIAIKVNDLKNAQFDLDTDLLKALLDEHFGKQSTHTPQSVDEVDWQKVACALAMRSGFSVITGGPGTGKTTTVTKLLAILQTLHQSQPLNIALCAPTGKAAARLSESIRDAKTKLKLSQVLSDAIPHEAKTLHRLLGVIPYTHRFRHHQENPLHCDVLVLDEASMVDLAMMSKVFDALPKGARVILLGDKDQLASVEAGNVMADFCQGAVLGQVPAYTDDTLTFLNAVACPLPQSLSKTPASLSGLVMLQKSYRFDGKSGIGQLALAVNQGDWNAFLAAANNPAFSTELNLQTLDAQSHQALIQQASMAHHLVLEALAEDDVIKAHQAFLSYQVLAAVKAGPFGVTGLNERIEQQLVRQGKISGGRHYVSKPIMITDNDYQLGLFNGDIGLIVRHNGQLMASFVDADDTVRYFALARLPQHDTVYAMTIHKSQGSEFAHTAIVLPPVGQANVGINRQLLYTGITRAKKQLTLVAHPDVSRVAMMRVLNRHSGLTELIS